jgi:3-hydroxybutyryl-CoA dehydrogenase
MQIRKVGVVGAGLMGSGIAQVCAQAGYEATVCEASQELLDAGLGRIQRTLSGAVTKGKLDGREHPL